MTSIFYILFCIFSLLAIPLALAQDSTATPAVSDAPLVTENFAGLVQYTSGSPENTTSHAKLEFKDVLKFEQTLEIPKDSKIKIITQKRCIAVLYENSEIITPKDKLSPWILKKGTARWICPEEKIEKIIFVSADIEIQNGEVLFDKKFLLIYKDQIKNKSKLLKTALVYALKGQRFLPLKDQPEAADIWKRDDKYPLPKESIRWVAEKPEPSIDPNITRIYLQGLPIGIGGLHDWNHDRDFTEQNFENHGARLGTNFKFKNYSVMAFVEFFESANADSKQHSNGPSPVGYFSNRTESFIAAIGLRHDHLKAGSFYYYLGYARQELEVFARPDNLSDYKVRVVYNWNLVGGLGYQYILFPKSWFSILLATEARFIQTLYRGSIKELSYPPSAEPIDPRGHFLNYSMNFYIGPSFNF